MKLKIIAGTAITLLFGATAACSGGPSTTSPPTVQANPSSSAQASATPSAAPVNVKTLRITEKDLGSRWKATSSNDDRPIGECNEAGLPGQVQSDQASYGSFAERKGAHPAQLTVGIAALPTSDDAALTSAARAEIKKCDGKSKYGWFLTSSFDESRSVAGADQVLMTYRQTAYMDKGHKSLLYVRQGMMLRSGTMVVDIDNAFVPKPADRTGKSFASTDAIATQQLTKISSGAGQ